MQRDLEDKLVRHRSAVYTRLTRAGGVNPEDGTPVFPGGWRGDGFLEWKSEEIKEILKCVVSTTDECPSALLRLKLICHAFAGCSRGRTASPPGLIWRITLGMSSRAPFTFALHQGDFSRLTLISPLSQLPGRGRSLLERPPSG